MKLSNGPLGCISLSWFVDLVDLVGFFVGGSVSDSGVRVKDENMKKIKDSNTLCLFIVFLSFYCFL